MQALAGRAVHGGAQEPALQAGTCDDETHQLNEPLGLEVLGLPGYFQFPLSLAWHYISKLMQTSGRIDSS